MIKQRLSNFELIRVIAMLMIVSSHYLGHGILKVSSSECYNVYIQGDFINRLISVLYSPGGKTGVALFFMITGYFIGNKKLVISQKKSCSSMHILCNITSGNCFDNCSLSSV